MLIVKSNLSCLAFRCLAFICAFAWTLPPGGGVVLAQAATPIEDVQSIGGKWFVKGGEKPVYLYRDGSEMVDLFSYHSQDSNKDGIDNLRISHDKVHLIVESQGYPNHPTAIFPNSSNPNSIAVQNFTFRLPLEPKLAGKVTRLPMGPTGMASNGVVFFNPFEMEGMNAVEGYTEVWLDSCCGHPQQSGVYHYHKYPSCVKSPFSDDGERHSPILGFAFDGFPIYGPFEAAGLKAKDAKGELALDVCNGHSDAARGYHYHVTPGRFPYIFGGYAGVVEPSNNRGLRRAGEGPLVDNTKQGDNRMDKVIVAVRPGIVNRGEKHTIQIALNPEAAKRRPVPTDAPTWAQIGPYESKSISRDGNTVTIEINVPAEASVGIFLDCHLEFASQRGAPVTFKLNDALRVSKKL